MQPKTASLLPAEPVSARAVRRQDKIRQIVAAAKDVFLEDGFSAASMDKIVQKAGVSKRTLYNHFASKEEIFIVVMQSQLDLLYQHFDRDWEARGTLAEQLQRVGIDMLRIANSPETLSLFRITAAEAHRFPTLAQQFFEQRFEKVIDGIALILVRDGAHSGVRIADPREAGEYFLDLIFGTAYHRVVFGTIPPMNDKAIRMRIKRALRYFLDSR